MSIDKDALLDHIRNVSMYTNNKKKAIIEANVRAVPKIPRFQEPFPRMRRPEKEVNDSSSSGYTKEEEELMRGVPKFKTGPSPRSQSQTEEPPKEEAPTTPKMKTEEGEKEVKEEIKEDKVEQDEKITELNELSSALIWEDDFTDVEKRALLKIPGDVWVPFYKKELLASSEDIQLAIESKDQKAEVRCIDENKHVLYVPLMYLNKFYSVGGELDILINSEKYEVMKLFPKTYVDDVKAVKFGDDVVFRRKSSDTIALDKMDNNTFFSLFTKDSKQSIEGVVKELKYKKAPKPTLKMVDEDEELKMVDEDEEIENNKPVINVDSYKNLPRMQMFDEDDFPKKKKRGRPKGSKTKPK